MVLTNHLRYQVNNIGVEKRVFIGNPGVGKSTLLNSVAGKVIFKSGISAGKGLTSQLDQQRVGSITYCDTPGLADDTHRKAAGVAISKVLKEGGPSQIIFVVTEEAGRVRPQDAATMRLVLDAAPEIGSSFGIIVNKCTKKKKEFLKDPDNWLLFVTHLFHGIEEKNKHENIFLLDRIEDLEDETDAFVTADDIDGLVHFMDTRLPVVNLTPNKAKDIKTDELEKLKEQMEKKYTELDNDKKALQAELEKMKGVLEQERGKKGRPFHLGKLLGGIVEGVVGGIGKPGQLVGGIVEGVVDGIGKPLKSAGKKIEKVFKGLCFSDSTSVWTKNETSPDTTADQIMVTSLREGDLVGTLDASSTTNQYNKFMWTRATDVTIYKGNWTAHTFVFTSHLHLTVTSPHLMIIVKKDGFYFIRADHVKIGDEMFVNKKLRQVTTNLLKLSYVMKYLR